MDYCVFLQTFVSGDFLKPKARSLIKAIDFALTYKQEILTKKWIPSSSLAWVIGRMMTTDLLEAPQSEV